MTDAAPASPSPVVPPLRGRHWIELGLLTLFALFLRVGAAWGLGEGAPFGPDGTGAEAAVVLGNHLYPLHIEAIRVVGDARTLSVLTGTITIPLLYVLGHRSRLTGAGVWFAAALPIAIYTSALSAGDAPALFVVVLGAVIASFGRWGALLGGAVAMLSVAVKPIAAPALGLLLLHPLSLVGALGTLPVTAGWLQPLWGPRDRAGLLGSWWPELGNSLPTTPPDVGFILSNGVGHLGEQGLWVGAWLAVVAAVGACFPPPKGAPDVGPATRAAVLPLVFCLIGIAGAFGDRVSPRYFAAVLVPVTLWAGLLVPRPLAAILLIPSMALVSQVGLYRAQMDRGAVVPPLPLLDTPAVDARLLFDEASTSDASRMRQEAARLAEELPQGATWKVSRRPHGREGELAWPLRVARPDIRIVVTD